MAQDIKNEEVEEVQEEEVVEAAEETTPESLSWTWQVNVRMSSKTNTFALMQKCKISNAVQTKSVKICNVIVARTWQKQFSLLWIT